MPAKPFVLFVHGSWHVPEHFDAVRTLFHEAGYSTSCPRHASVGNKPPISLKEDAQVIRDELSRLIDDQGLDVLVVAHSYGGVVATEAVDARFAKETRAANKQSGGVIHILFIASFLLQVGSSIGSTFGGNLPPFIVLDPKTSLCTPTLPIPTFYHDLPTASDQQHYASLLLPSPTSTQFAPVTQTAYAFHPSTYMYCTQDKALPLEVQQMLVNGVRDRGGRIASVSCEGGHSVYLSMPGEVLGVVGGLHQ